MRVMTEPVTNEWNKKFPKVEDRGKLSKMPSDGNKNVSKFAKPDPQASLTDKAKTLANAHAGDAGKKVVEGTSLGVSIAQQATHNAGLLALTAAGAAASATGIGLVVTGGIATLTLSSLSAYSAVKSNRHANALSTIVDRHDCYRCKHVDGSKADKYAHRHIAFDVGPYIVAQKEEKTARKGIGAVPVIGVGGSLYTLGRALYKKASGTKGVKRFEHASALAAHLITHDCGLAQAIVANLYSFEVMCWLLTQEHDVVTQALAAKMKSV